MFSDHYAEFLYTDKITAITFYCSVFTCSFFLVEFLLKQSFPLSVPVSIFPNGPAQRTLTITHFQNTVDKEK